MSPISGTGGLIWWHRCLVGALSPLLYDDVAYIPSIYVYILGNFCSSGLPYSISKDLSVICPSPDSLDVNMYREKLFSAVLIFYKTVFVIFFFFTNIAFTSLFASLSFLKCRLSKPSGFYVNTPIFVLANNLISFKYQSGWKKH
jgi:hypothetical protein